ncbi:uncharacterized protein F5147DRAFT_816040 [Suillus discolor]|uniref:F-box domain-containing protein n=1 Tax=Suillus discolor TaxID=1912936 RepID=A0A9P7EZR4_9AGAM|nr:uncharacterized protein F5147DRAFT_816040 [Suillus discolor]KAG2098214.1 hypothetical protein F5147DRAFT_816040 [Suillus discolor]
MPQAIKGITEVFGLDTINALQTILACSEQVTIPDLETSCSRFPNTDQSVTHNDQSIHAIISERQRQLDAVLHEISGLQSVMDGIKNIHRQLLKKKDRIRHSMILHKGLVSRLWRLPTEVLSQVFHHCLPDHCFPESNRPSALEAPVLLTGICRRWREVAAEHTQFMVQASRYDVWLKRSRGHPLSLSLVCEADDAARLQSLLQPYINQISSLSIIFHEDVVEPELLLDDLPVLRELTIRTLKENRNRHSPSIGKSLSRLPATLRSLKVVEWYFNTTQTSFGPAGSHLTNLDVATLLHQSTVIHLLQLCPNLSSFKFCGQFDTNETLDSFTHTNIQTFRVLARCDASSYLSGLFNALSLPNLRVLENYCSGSVRYPDEELKAFFARSKCPLERLIFSSRGKPTMTDEVRAKYINIFPSIEISLVEDLGNTPETKLVVELPPACRYELSAVLPQAPVPAFRSMTANPGFHMASTRVSTVRRVYAAGAQDQVPIFGEVLSPARPATSWLPRAVARPTAQQPGGLSFLAE